MIAIKTIKPVAPMPFEDKRESFAQVSFRYVDDKTFLLTVRMLLIWSNLSWRVSIVILEQAHEQRTLVLDDIFWFPELVEDVISVEAAVYTSVLWSVTEELNIPSLTGIVDTDSPLETKSEVDLAANITVRVDDSGLLYSLRIGLDGPSDINSVVEVTSVLISRVDDSGSLYPVAVSLDGLGFSIDAPSK